MISLPTDEFEKVSDICEKEGYRRTFDFQYNLRYDFSSDPEYTLVLGAKIPIILPFSHIFPIELVSFYISLVIRPRQFNEEILRFFLKTLKDLVNKLPAYTHEYNFQSYQNKIEEILNQYYPAKDISDPEKYLSENVLNSYLRDQIVKDTKASEINILGISQDVLNFYREFNLIPQNKLPTELENGVPQKRENLVLAFHNADFNDYLLEEHGSLSYWRDYLYKNIWIRVGMKTLAPGFLYKVFDGVDFQKSALYRDWIIYCRGLLRATMTIMDYPEFDRLENQYYCIKPFNETQFLKEKLLKKPLAGFFLPSVCFEILAESELIQPKYNFFEFPPITLEELSILEDFKISERLMQKGDYENAKQTLFNTGKKIQKYHHTQAQVKNLQQLVKILLKQEKYQDALNHIQWAMNLCRTGRIQLADIIQIHLTTAKIYAFLGNFQMAQQQFDITLKFLQSLPLKEERTTLMFQTYLELIKYSMNLKDFNSANNHFHTLANYAKNDPSFEFQYYSERANYYGLTGDKNKEFNSLQKALTVKDAPFNDTVRIHLNYAKLLLNFKNDPIKAIDSLTFIEKSITPQNLERIQLKIEALQILAEAYAIIKDNETVNKILADIELFKGRLNTL